MLANVALKRIGHNGSIVKLLRVSSSKRLTGNIQDYTTKRDDFLKTEMLVQEGPNIYDLPIIMKKTNDFEMILGKQLFSDKSTHVAEVSKINELKQDTTSLSDEKTIGEIDKNAYLFISDLAILNNLKFDQIFREIEKFTSLKEENSLESIVNKQMTSKVAMQTLRKIINQEKRKRKTSKYMKNHQKILLSQLTEFIATGKDGELVLEALALLLKDVSNISLNTYKEILINEALARASNGEFSIQQLIYLSRILFSSRSSHSNESVDYLWTGFIMKQKDIEVNHIVPLFKLLKHLKQSKDRVQKLLENKLIENYDRLSIFQISEILNSFNNSFYSSVALECIGKWAKDHLTSISKFNFLEFLENLIAVKYVSSDIEDSIAKYLSTKTIKSNDHALMAAVAVYCTTVHLRNEKILHEITKYLEKYAKRLPLGSFADIYCVFGTLNFEPNVKEGFWKVFENILDEKFSNLQISDVLCLLTTCACINKYLPDQTSKIFSSEFLEKLHSQSNIFTMECLREQLYILDTAMTIECPNYKGPLLFQSNSRMGLRVMDLRIRTILNEIHKDLVALAGDEQKLSKHVVSSKFSQMRLYTLDAVIHENPTASTELEFDTINRGRNRDTAILVVLPNHYCWNSDVLIGQQAMKVRHLRKLGLRVMLIDFEILNQLRKQPNEVEKYLKHKFKMALGAL